jgi:quercetin dioxygenase-like cupin family protein
LRNGNTNNCPLEYYTNWKGVPELSKFHWNEIQEDRLTEKITRKMVWGKNVMLARVELAPNTVLPTHSHEAEQVSVIEKGAIVFFFPDREEMALDTGDMLLIEPHRPHGARAGSEGCVSIDIFSPIRKDFIEGTATYFSDSLQGPEQVSDDSRTEMAYRQVQEAILGKDIRVSLEELKCVPLRDVVKFAYDRECISMGQIKSILGIGREEARALIREWKNWDDHSEYSLRRKLERLIILPGESGG